VTHPTAAQLRPIDLFDGVDDAELERFAAAAELRELPAGIVAIEQGTAQPVTLLLRGALDLSVVDPSGRADPLGRQVAPTWLGAIFAVTGEVSYVTVRTATDVALAEIDAEAFVELMRANRSIFDRVMRQVRPVVGRQAAREQNRERLESLGTMAAGLAHELNNPASAARRAADELAEALDVLGSTIGTFVESGVEREEARQLVELQRSALAQRDAAEPDDALARADAEDELLATLEELEVPEPWRLTEPLAAAGVDGAFLARVRELAGPATPAAVRWVAASLTARNLAAELAESTERMSSLVAAVKSYAYMDRGELVEADVHDGLDTTIKLLGHKLKHTEIALVRDYDRSLPKLTIRGGELNQVWTNLIDNAIQALGERGTITIATARDGPCARVDIGDDGPGIAADVRPHIFDPFFTTKEVGQGTGLGLDAVRRIIVEGHGGSVDVDSEPGRTVFHVWLPLVAPKP
jgi:signal transduction histidine kinase